MFCFFKPASVIISSTLQISGEINNLSLLLVNTNVFGNASFSNVVGIEFGTEFKEIILVGNTETEKLRLSGDQFSSGWYLCVPPLNVASEAIPMYV